MPQEMKPEVLTRAPTEVRPTLAQLIKWIEPENTGIIPGPQFGKADRSNQ